MLQSFLSTANILHISKLKKKKEIPINLRNTLITGLFKGTAYGNLITLKQQEGLMMEVTARMYVAVKGDVNARKGFEKIHFTEQGVVISGRNIKVFEVQPSTINR